MTSENIKEIGERIKHIRIRMYFGIKELAKEIDVNAKLLEDWEAGNVIPKGETLERFCEFSGATRDYILLGKGEWVDDIKELIKELHDGRIK